MSDKERRTFSLDPANDEYCKELDNASAKVNRIITQLRKGAAADTVAIDTQLQQKRRELNEAERKVERIEDDIAELERVKADLTSQDWAEMTEARNALRNTPKNPTNPAIKKWANKLGMTPERLVERLDKDA